MFPYILLIFIPFLFSFVAIAPLTKTNGKLNSFKLKVGDSKFIKNNNLALFMFFVIFFILLCCRDISIGRDVPVYKYYFEQYNSMTFPELLKLDGDFLYILLNWIIGRITDNFQYFLSCVAAIILLPIYRTYSNDKNKSFMKIVLFMNMPVFIMIFSGLRQSIAFSIGMIAYEFVKEKRIIPFVVTVLIAMGFHHSAFILFILYPLYYWRSNKKSFIFIVPFTILVYIFNKPIFSVLLDVLNTLSNGQYNASISSTGAVTTIILFALFLALSYVVTDEAALDEEMIGLRNILMFALWIQCFAPLHSLAMRFNYYFIMFIPMLMPRIVAYSKPRYKNVARLAEVVITVYLLFHYLKNTYNACLTGKSSLDTYPYKAFWDK